ncbi:MAG: hypothetical protein DMH00_13460, partial [Acidobacteria bacterium]
MTEASTAEAPARSPFTDSRLARTPFRGGRKVDFPILVAPMVGISHVAFRALVRTYLPADCSTLLFTEMLSSRRLPAERVGSTPLTYVLEGGESNLIPQLLANEERFIAASVRKLEVMAPAGIDINMGCPVKQALSHNWGVALMGDIRYAADVVAVTRCHVRQPLSVKMRSGLREERRRGRLGDTAPAPPAAGTPGTGLLGGHREGPRRGADPGGGERRRADRRGCFGNAGGDRLRRGDGGPGGDGPALDLLAARRGVWFRSSARTRGGASAAHSRR